MLYRVVIAMKSLNVRAIECLALKLIHAQSSSINVSVKQPLSYIILSLYGNLTRE